MTIEALCKTYPDVPRSAMIKTEALRLGVRLSQAARDAAREVDTVFKGYFLFSEDVGAESTRPENIPMFFCLSCDDTFTVIRVNPRSIYSIDWTGEGFVFCDEAGEVEQVYLPPGRKWTKEKLEDGTPLQAVGFPLGRDKIACCFDYYCEYWKTKEQCLFCDIVAHLRTKKAKEDKVVTRHKPETVAKVIARAFEEPGMRHMTLSSGSILGPRDGKSETEWLCDYLHAIREALGNETWSAYFQIGAKPRREVEMLHDTGISGLQMNLEVWDEAVFSALCPGKSKSVGRETWLRRMIEAVDVFGKGNILSNFVTGVEMAQPWGFDNAAAAVRSTLGGFEYLMSHDVLPRMEIWCIEPQSALAGQEPAPLEYYVELQRGYLELRQKYGFPFPFPGQCRHCYACDPLDVWDYYLWGKPNNDTQIGDGDTQRGDR